MYVLRYVVGIDLNPKNGGGDKEEAPHGWRHG